MLLGSTGTLNVRTHLFFMVPALLTAGFFDYERLGGDPTLWLALALLGVLATILPIELLKPFVRRVANTAARASLAALLLLSAGLLRGLTIFYLGRLFDLIPEDDIVYRLFGGPVFVMSYYLVTNAAVEVYLRHKDQILKLTADQLRLERIKSGYKSDLRAVNQQQRTRVRELLAAPMWELQKKLEGAKNKAELQDALLAIQAINHDVVRPLSHSLAQSDSPATSVIRTTSLRVSPWPKRIVLGEVLPTWFYLLIILTIGLNAQIAVSSIGQGLIVIGVSLIPILILFYGEKYLFRSISMPLVPAVVLSLSLGGAAGALAGYLAIYLDVATTTNYWWQAATYLFVTKGITLAFGIFELGWRRAQDQLMEVNDQLMVVNSRLRQQLWLGQKSLAMELHGSVQGMLHAQASKLARLEKPESRQIQEILAAIRGSLDRIENEDYLAGGTILSLLEELVLLWEGTVDITWSIDEKAGKILAEDVGLSRVIFEVVREAVTNSVKHGDAKNIEIQLTFSDQIELRLTNDGALVESSESFAGKELIEQLCLTHSLKNTGAGVELQARFALSPEL